jgi:membrane fusion protein, multidrug efflux system
LYTLPTSEEAARVQAPAASDGFLCPGSHTPGAFRERQRQLRISPKRVHRNNARAIIMTKHQNPAHQSESSIVGVNEPGAQSRKRRVVRNVLLALLAAVALLGGWLAYTTGAIPGLASTDPGPGFAPKAVVVRAKVAKKGDLNVFVSGLGTVTSVNSVTVQSRVDGELVRQFFTEGQNVRAGDVLAEIDPRSYQASLKEAEGTLAKDEAQLKSAIKDLARYRVLLKQDSISAQKVDNAVDTVHQYEGAVKSDAASVQAAKVNLSRCRITAPCSGRLGLRQVNPGNIVTANSTNIVVITQMQPIDVVFTIPEPRLPEVLAALRQNKQLAVEAWDRENTSKIEEGALLTMDNEINTSTGTIKLKARFKNAEEKLFPNQFVNARLQVNTVTGATLVPEVTIQQGSSGPFVYVIGKDHKAKFTKITRGPTSGGLTVITQGVAPGDVLAMDGVDNLRDGTPVEAVIE